MVHPAVFFKTAFLRTGRWLFSSDNSGGIIEGLPKNQKVLGLA